MRREPPIGRRRELAGSGMDGSLAVVAANIGNHATRRQFGEPQRTTPPDNFITVRPAQDALAPPEKANSLTN